ncbi:MULTISPECIES: ABC transporter ATP-binding protein [Actibacterium]|uniref:Simple sugar transport system ATP-binding protein n=1 Tax=Actibacterium naphthalenivorans TaxID=1614693 RepID=A0A840CCW7_9RHOB|nr:MULTISPECIES: ABC transporter ATP-binding protein [Actibacterium]ALG89659.1 ABC transporter ATP-binding protein [Actibacterium sp. EMB200-NS6]MBB4020666.1 simple sugar transport system ATP-binding protein [Actibacterium naphthalenivorans]
MSHERALPTGAIGVEAVGMTMRFGDFTALDNVTVNIRPGTFHALLGENGAGKSTLVKCIMGFYHATSGGVLVDGHEALMTDPKAAHALGLGMVYQHFTLVPSLTAAENLVISRADAPRVINWGKERADLAAFMARMPFHVPLDQPVNRLAAGEKQKLEILKQLYLGRRFLILDEPTSVLTPAEAEDVLGHVRALTRAGEITVLMITHKFREVTRFADDLTVLRRGSHAGGGAVAELSHDDMARMMMGADPDLRSIDRTGGAGAVVLKLDGVRATDRSGLKPIEIDALDVRAGEVLGIAGVSGNGQMELMEILTGQRALEGGAVMVKGNAFTATRAEAKAHKVRYLPEEPLRNACAPKMSVAENLAFRLFDVGAGPKPRFWKSGRQIAENAQAMIAGFKIKTASPQSPIAALSGGNVQRAVLARELSGDVDLLIVSNPCFGLDFAAVSAIRARIIAARNKGAAVLLISEDLDEILELSDRIVVMSEGRIAYETPGATADVAEIGRYMAGHG